MLGFSIYYPYALPVLASRMMALVRSRFGYHSTSYGSSMAAGAAFGGLAGFTVGGMAAAGEYSYDTLKQIILTINGQFHNINQSIINASMGGM